MNLPVLTSLITDSTYTAEQMKAYGQQYRELALEEAAQEFDRRALPGFGYYEIAEPAKIIRSMK